MGLWHYETIPEPQAYGDDTTYELGFAWLADCDLVEDWGCGTAYGRRFRSGAYKGIDGSVSRFADLITDLRTYRSQADGIFMRHVLEHNHDWRQILAGALESFRRRFVLVIYTPLGDETRVLTHGAIPDISFARGDLTGYLAPFLAEEHSLTTDTWYGSETVFCCERPS